MNTLILLLAISGPGQTTTIQVPPMVIGNQQRTFGRFGIWRLTVKNSPGARITIINTPRDSSYNYSYRPRWRLFQQRARSRGRL